MKVKDIMTAKALKSCSPDANLQEAAKEMKAGNCGVLPVVDLNKKVVGVITDRDICLSMSKKEPLVHAEISVSEIMQKNVQTVKEDDDITIALKQMRTQHVGRLPVVDGDGKLKGILSLHKLVSRSLQGQDELGRLSTPGENLLKTIKALSDHYTITPMREERVIETGI